MLLYLFNGQMQVRAEKLLLNKMSKTKKKKHLDQNFERFKQQKCALGLKNKEKKARGGGK